MLFRSWVNTRLDSQIEGRKLFDRFGVRMDVVQEGFQVVTDGLDRSAVEANR